MYANPPIHAKFWPDPSIRHYFRSNPDMHYLKLSVVKYTAFGYIYLFSFSSTVFIFIGVRAGGAGGAAAPPLAKIFGQNACDSGKSTWDKIFID